MITVCRCTTERVCTSCQQQIDHRQTRDNDWFFDTFNEGWNVPPGGEPR